MGAALLATSVFLHLPFVLPRYFGMDLVLAALILIGVGLLLSVRILGLAHLHLPKLYIAAVCIWLVSALVSIVFSNAPDASYEALRLILPGMVLVGIILALINDAQALSNVLNGIIAASVILAGIAVIQRVFEMDQANFGGFGVSSVRHIANDVDEVRPGGPVGDPNFFATYLIPAALISASRLFGARDWKNTVFYLLVSLICVGGILVTASRGGVLAFGLGLLLLIALERKVWPFFLIVIASVTILLSKPEAYIERFSGGMTALVATVTGRLNESEVSENALAGRLGEMKAAVYMFLDEPITGVGYGQFEEYFQSYVARYDILMRNADRGAHSLYLETAAETGIVGLAALLIVFALGFSNVIVLGRTAKMTGRNDLFRDIRSLAVAITFILVSHWLLHDAKASYLWLFIGLLFVPVAIFEPYRNEAFDAPRYGVVKSEGVLP